MANFLDDNMAEPSLSRAHKLVDTAAINAEKNLSDILARAAKLICYHAGGLAVHGRSGGALYPNAVGFDLNLSRALLQEAETFFISAELLISEMRVARYSLSNVFKWLRELHETYSDKHSNSSSTEDTLKYKFKATSQREMASLLKITPCVRLDSSVARPRTEILLDINITALLGPSRTAKACIPENANS